MRAILVLAFSLSTPAVSLAADPPPRYQRATLTFDITVHNPNRQKTRHVTKIGVRSRTAPQAFTCLGEATALFPLADYVVRFRPGVAETTVSADPPLAMPPQSSARFKVGLYPDDRDACGGWSASVSVLVSFDDGTVLTTPEQVITAADLKAASARGLSPGELRLAVAHRDPLVRERAVAALPVDPKEAVEYLRLLLNDPNPDVRINAYGAIAARSLTALGPELIRRFDQLSDGTEAAALVTAVGELRDETAIPKILQLLETPDPASIPAIIDALKNMRDRRLIASLLNFLEARPEWRRQEMWMTASTLAARRIVSIVIESRDRAAIPQLSALIGQTSNELLRDDVLSQLEALPAADATASFLHGFEPVLEKLLADKRATARRAAFRVLLKAVATDREAARRVLLEGLHSEDSGLRVDACSAAERLAITAVASTVAEVGRQGGEFNRQRCCAAASNLGSPCPP
jgi:HEAT repeat protein